MTLDQDIRIPVSITKQVKIGNTVSPGMNIDGSLDHVVSLTDWINHNILEGRLDVTGSLGNTVVTTTDTQTITGAKTFSGAVALNGGLTMDTNKFIVADTSGNVTMAGTVTASNAAVSLTAVPTYADDTAAGAGGLAAGRVYKTATGELRIKL